MLRVRGDSMLEAGIMAGDYAVVRQTTEVRKGDIIVAGIPGEEATVKRFSRKGNKIVLLPANADYGPIELEPDQVRIYGKVVTIVRQL
jgi:repressor LexA